MNNLQKHIQNSAKHLGRCLNEISFREKWDILILVSGKFLRTVYMVQREMKLIAGVVPLRSCWQKWKFILGDKMSCRHYPKWNHMKENIFAYVYFIKAKMIGFYWIGRSSRATPETKFHFISLTMKSDVNRISLMVGWNFIFGRFHCGPHVNTL